MLVCSGFIPVATDADDAINPRFLSVYDYSISNSYADFQSAIRLSKVSWMFLVVLVCK
jgi:hypothetical protein